VFDLNDVALFVEVVRCGSFAEAARRHGMPANTVSRRIQALESRMATRLLQRSTRKLTLTAAGQAFHERCAGAVDGLLEAQQALVTGSSAPSGLVRVAAPADFFDFVPMQWVVEYLVAHPQVRIDFVLSDATADLIAERIDVAFRGGPLPDSGYVGRRLMNPGSGGLVASPAYLQSRGTPATLQDLANHDCVTSHHPGGRARWRLTDQDGMVHEVHVVGRFSANTAQALRKAAVSGLGVALLPPNLAKLDVEAGMLTPVLPQYRLAGQGLNALYPSRRHLPPAVTAFIDHVVRKLETANALFPQLAPASPRGAATERDRKRRTSVR